MSRGEGIVGREADPNGRRIRGVVHGGGVGAPRPTKWYNFGERADRVVRPYEGNKGCLRLSRRGTRAPPYEIFRSAKRRGRCPHRPEMISPYFA